MERIVNVSTIEEEFKKARVKAHVRTRKGKMERVREFERKGKFPRRIAGEQLTISTFGPPDHVEIIDEFNAMMKETGKIPTVARLKTFMSRTYKSKDMSKWIQDPKVKKNAIKGLEGEQETVTKHTISAIRRMENDIKEKIFSEGKQEDEDMVSMYKGDLRNIKKIKSYVKAGNWERASDVFGSLDTSVKDSLIDFMPKKMIDFIGRYLGFGRI